MPSPYLSIIIPAYNEEKRLPETLDAVRAYIDGGTWRAHTTENATAEILIVDDGSTDATVKISESYALKHPDFPLRVVRQPQNQGKGSAVRRGMLEAKGAFRLFTDADSSTPIEELDKLLLFAGDVDPQSIGAPFQEKKKYAVVIGSRYLDQKSIKIKQPLKRRILSRSVNRLIQTLVLPGIVDTQCGFKLFSAKAAEKIFQRIGVAGWLFDVEVLTVAYQRGYSIKEVPVDWYNSAQSRLRTTRTAVRTIKDLYGIRKNARRGAYAP